MLADIPDDEAQYWTGKLERINTMSIDDEVTESTQMQRLSWLNTLVASAVDSYIFLFPLCVSCPAQFQLQDDSHPLPFAASQCCELCLHRFPSRPLGGAAIMSPSPPN